MTYSPQRFIDLHIHTTFSDGSYSPVEVVRRAKELGLEAISITDHDDVSGITQAITSGQKLGVEVISGVELSTHGNGFDVHILGYLFDHNAESIQTYIEHFQEERRQRSRKIVERLHQLGFKVSYDLVCQKAGEGSIGRPHVATVMKEEGYVFSIEEAFKKYLGDGKPAFVPKLKIEPLRAIRLIHNAGGLAFIAHPAVDVDEEYVVSLIQLGLDGIETIHPHHNRAAVQKYRQLAQQHNVLECGGSDCHGNLNGYEMIGKMAVPYSFLSKMKEHLSS